MIRLLRLLALVGLLAALGLAAPGARAAEAGREQVLVMLKLTPQHARPNAGYGGAYGGGEGRAARLRVASRLARQYGVSIVSNWPMPLLGVDCFVMTAAPGQSAEALAAQLSKDPGVSWSEPLHYYGAQGQAQAEAVSHNDPLYRVQPAAGAWRLAALHQISTGRNVRVAVIDSMVEGAHPDLAGQVEVSQNFVAGRAAPPEQHGTAVAGIIAARADNGAGIAGVAPGARIMALRACWQAAGQAGTVCDTLSLAKALDYAINHGARVINLSLSGPRDQLLARLLDAAMARGAVVVGAYDRTLEGGGFPASHRGVVAVTAEGAPVAGVVSAPGRDVPTTLPGGRWSLVAGSSYAAAHVSGLFALMRARAPSERRAPMLVIARPADTIDTCATLLQMSGPCDCSCARPRELLASLPQ